MSNVKLSIQPGTSDVKNTDQYCIFNSRGYGSSIAAWFIEIWSRDLDR